MSNISRRVAISALTSMALLPVAASSQTLPDKPIRLVVIVAPGGSADFFARLLAEKLQHRLNRTVIVENKPGAGGNIATAFVAKAEPDGTTLLFTSNNHTINPYIYKSAGYSPDRDFAPVAQVARGPAVLVVNPKVPINSFQDYVAASKRSPMFYATYGAGSAAHLAGELLATTAGAKMDHVAYKGAGPALADVVAGQTPSAILSLFATTPFLKDGKLRPLAVFSKERSPAFPDVPTVAESGYPDLNYDIWLGILAPRNTPAAIVNTLNTEIRAVLGDPGNASKVREQAMATVNESPEDFRAFLRRENDLVQKIVTKSKIEIQ